MATKVIIKYSFKIKEENLKHHQKLPQQIAPVTQI
jgi:hypothetical protein